jgi:hypothetical protein
MNKLHKDIERLEKLVPTAKSFPKGIYYWQAAMSTVIEVDEKRAERLERLGESVWLKGLANGS